MRDKSPINTYERESLRIAVRSMCSLLELYYNRDAFFQRDLQALEIRDELRKWERRVLYQPGDDPLIKLTPEATALTADQYVQILDTEKQHG